MRLSGISSSERRQVRWPLWGREAARGPEHGVPEWLARRLAMMTIETQGVLENFLNETPLLSGLSKKQSRRFRTVERALGGYARMLAEIEAGLQSKLSTEDIADVPPSKLSKRELEIIRRIAAGLSNKEVAAELGISTRTVESHRNRLKTKLDVTSLIGLVRYAIRAGLAPL